MNVPCATSADTDARMIRLEVYGVPQPQGSKKAFAVAGKARLVESAGGVKGWRDSIERAGQAWQALHHRPLLDDALEVTITFRMPRPKSAPKKRTLPTTKPDLDKLSRAVLDAVTGVVISDDARVVALHARKVYAGEEPPGAVIEIREVA